MYIGGYDFFASNLFARDTPRLTLLSSAIFLWSWTPEDSFSWPGEEGHGGHGAGGADSAAHASGDALLEEAGQRALALAPERLQAVDPRGLVDLTRDQVQLASAAAFAQFEAPENLVNLTCNLHGTGSCSTMV